MPVLRETVKEKENATKTEVELAFEGLKEYFKECKLNNIPLNSGEPCDMEKWVEEFYS